MHLGWFNVISQASANAVSASLSGFWIPWRPSTRRSLMRPCKHAAQKAVEVVHRCCLGARPTVETIWHSDTSAGSPHSLHDFFCMEIPFPLVEQLEEGNKSVDRFTVQFVRTSNSRGVPPHTPPTFRLNPSRATITLEGSQASLRCSVGSWWECWPLQPRTGVGNRLPGLEMNRIPLA